MKFFQAAKITPKAAMYIDVADTLSMIATKAVVALRHVDVGMTWNETMPPGVRVLRDPYLNGTGTDSSAIWAARLTSPMTKDRLTLLHSASLRQLHPYYGKAAARW